MTAGSNKGHKHSEATILKLKNYKPANDTLIKLRQAKELEGITIIVINKKTNFIKKYNSLRSAARNLNVSHTGLRYGVKKKILLRNSFLLINVIKIQFY